MTDKKRLLMGIGIGVVVYIIMYFLMNHAFASPRLQSPWINVQYQEFSDCCERTYTVVKGDTVAAIAKRFLGDWRKWKQIAEINNLKVLPGNIIIIRPGQVLKLDRIKLTEREKMEAAQEAVWERMNKIFYWRTRKKGYPKHPTTSWAQAPLRMIDSSTDRMTMKMVFAETIHRTEWLDVVRIYDTMLTTTHTPEALIRLAAMSWSESDNTNVRGKAGEVGNMQIQPATGKDILRSMGIDVTHMDLEDVETLLKDVRVNTRLGGYHFNNLLSRYDGNVYMALRRYNGNVKMEETRIYADRITGRITKIVASYQKKLTKLYDEKELRTR